MGSHARIAAAACLVASGLLAGGAATAPAFAEPGHRHEDRSERSDPPVRDDGRPVRGAGARVGAADSNGPESDPVDHGADDEGDPDDPESGPADLDVDRGAEGDPDDPDTGDCGRGGWRWPRSRSRVEPEEVGSGGDYRFGGGLPSRLPAGEIGSAATAERPEVLPPLGDPARPDAIDTVPGIELGAGDAGGAPVSAPAGGVGLPAAGAAIGPPGLPAAPRQASATPPQADVRVPASSYRVGYGEYLRTAGMSQVAALALAGLAGILVLTGAGGLVGYRQAKAGHAVRTSGIARFMN